MADSLISAIALDLGSTTVKAALLDRHGTLLHATALPAPPLHGSNGVQEGDALAYARVADEVLAQCRKQTGASPPLGLCSQRSTFLLWERSSGKPVTPLISWQDNRGEASCTALHVYEAQIHQLTGLRLTPYYLAPKLRVLLQQHADWRARLESREWCIGTLDSFLIWRWSGGQQHVTDASMAARTLLMDINTQQWSPQLCALFGIPPAALPRILPSSGLNLALHNGLTLQASVADQSAALLACMSPDSRDVLVNLGTGGFVIRYPGSSESPRSGYLRTLVYQAGSAPARFAVEGTLNSIASALADYPVAECNVEDLARNDVYCLAEPSGLGAPYFRSELGLHFSSPVNELSPREQAALLLEGIMFRVCRIVEDFEMGTGVGNIYLSGGLSELICLQQGIAACAPAPVFHLQQHDASLLGAAMLAAGQPLGAPPVATHVSIPHNAERLRQKYLRWKIWLDGLL
ncbi:MAG TPA: FGGY family carbohydrate kinase [Steroidobacteraceae bacterium]|nr:FGGY family carbohydrate kinase [Steroidobacteraceae bacterium]